MSTGSSFLSAASLIMGALFVALAVPLIRRRVPPNHWYGLRIPATFADERVWYEANARAGRELLALGVGAMALGVVLYLVPMPSWLGAALWIVFILGGVILFVVRSWRLANRRLEHYRRETGE